LNKRRRHGVCYRLAISSICSYWVLKLALARSERAVLRSARHVVAAPNQVIPVLAIVRGADTVEAGFEAELSATHKRIPVEHLRECVTITVRSTVRIHDAAERVALQVSAMRVQLSSVVVWGKVECAVVNEPDSLNVSGRAHELQPSYSTWRDKSRSVGWLRAKCHNLGFVVSNAATDFRRTPQAEVVRSVEYQGLTVAVLTQSRRVAYIETKLRSTEHRERVDLIREFREGKLQC
jgi:hypothetical protein